MRRILVIAEFYPEKKSDWKGVFVKDHVQALSQWADVEVLCTRPWGEVTGIKSLTQENVHVHFAIPNKRGGSGLSKLVEMARWYRQAERIAQKLSPPDHIQVHNSLFQGRLAKRLAKYWNITYSVVEHTGPFSTISNDAWKLKQARKVMEEAEAVFCVSNRLREEISNSGINPKRLSVCLNPVDDSNFKPALPGPHETITFVGRLDEFKGAMRCVRAFQQIHQRYPNLKLKIVGEGEEFNPIRSFIIENGLAKRVQMFGFLSRKEVFDVMKRTDVLLLPSRHESFGMVAAEAWMMGIPVVIGKNCGATDLMQMIDLPIGLIVDGDNINEIAASCAAILDNRDQYEPEAMRKSMLKICGIESFSLRQRELLEPSKQLS